MASGMVYSWLHNVWYGDGRFGWLLLPLTLHFGWTTAATLVNSNSSLAALLNPGDDRWIVAAGHASTVAATALGVAVTWVGENVAWRATNAL